MFYWKWTWGTHHRRHRHKHSHHKHRLLLVVIVEGKERTFALIEPGKEANLMTTVSVGHKVALAVGFLDTNGNPMVMAPTPDSPPAWINSNPAAETLVAAADGLSAVTTTVAPGNDVVSLTVVVGAASFSATLAVEVDAAPQVLGSVVINPTVQ